MVICQSVRVSPSSAGERKKEMYSGTEEGILELVKRLVHSNSMLCTHEEARTTSFLKQFCLRPFAHTPAPGSARNKTFHFQCNFAKENFFLLFSLSLSSFTSPLLFYSKVFPNPICSQFFSVVAADTLRAQPSSPLPF